MAKSKTGSLTVVIAIAVVISMLLWNVPTASLHNNGLDTNNGDDEDYVRIINYYGSEGGVLLGSDSYYLGETADVRFDIVDSSVKINNTYKAFLGWSLTPNATTADYYTDINANTITSNNRGDTPGGKRTLEITFEDYRNDYDKTKGIRLYAVWGDVIPVTLTSDGVAQLAKKYEFNVASGASNYKTVYDPAGNYPNRPT